MNDYLVRPASGIGGEITPPADKSISHRAAIFSSLAEGESRISNYLFAEDCVNTLRVLKSLGVKIEEE
ncbi:MAG: 3-phosphoshikimate 1-carboxyvinyltransferase, partial [Elusimicrobia bacterium]|nr:3-phosphoshikimate 1-carboxyvinyltransferase [Elusimicrobiota bacterium]